MIHVLMIDYNGSWNFARPFKYVAASIFFYHKENGGPSKGRYTDITR